MKNYNPNNSTLIKICDQWFNSNDFLLSVSLSKSMAKQIPEYVVLFSINPKQRENKYDSKEGDLNTSVSFKFMPIQCYSICEIITLISQGSVSEVESYEIKTNPEISSYNSHFKTLSFAEEYDEKRKITKFIINFSIENHKFSCSLDLPTALGFRDVLLDYTKKAMDLNISVRSR